MSDEPTTVDLNRLPEMLRHLVLAWLTICALALAACSDNSETVDETKPAQSEPRQVETIIVKAELLANPVKAFGTIAAKQRSAIGALAEGPVERIFVKVGDRVTRGQPLFRIRQADYQRRVAEAQAALDLTEAQAIEAERRYGRVMALAPRGFVSKAQVDAVETELAISRAQKAQAEAILGTARQALSDTITRAPYDGVVTARLVDEGVYLNNRFSMGGQSAALELQELGIVAAIVNAPQEYVDSFSRNMPARVFIEGFDEPFDSTVYIINDRVDPTSRMVELRLPIRNPNYRISSGLAARAQIEVPPEQAIILPRTAIQGDSASANVFVVEDGNAQRREVTYDSIDLDRARIRSGLSEGDEVIPSPPATLRDGEPVTTRSDSSET
jgi:RND family efflux transporter MFP subunit